MMPVMTGFDVLEALAAEGYNGRLPVIVISAMNEMEPTVPRDRTRCRGFPVESRSIRPCCGQGCWATLEKKQLRDEMNDELARKQRELREGPAAAAGAGAAALMRKPG